MMTSARLAFMAKLGRQILAEESAERRHADFDGGLGGSIRRVDPQDGDAVLHEVLEKISVVAGEFDDEAVFVELARGEQIQRVLARVLEQMVGEARNSRGSPR